MKKRLNCIMLIDDDADDNYYHQIILKKMDIADHIEVAESGPEALDYLKKEDQIKRDNGNLILNEELQWIFDFEKAVEVTIIETTYTKGHTVFC